MSRLTDHLIVLSFDCLSSLDLPMLGELPNFKALFNEAAICRNVETIYPCCAIYYWGIVLKFVPESEVKAV